MPTIPGNSGFAVLLPGRRKAASSFEFLAHHKFDFNKWAYEGLPYLRYDQEEELRKSLKTKSLFGSIKGTRDELIVQDHCSRVAKWLTTNPKDGDELPLTVEPVVSDYIIHKEIRMRYHELWTYGNNNKKVVVKKVSHAERQQLEKLDDGLDERLVESFLGFTRIFKALVTFKKPLVGHNLLTDLLLMYNLFYKPLPKSYDSFKEEITDLFPKVYDTKHISMCLRKSFGDISDIFQSNVLPELYVAMDSHQGRFQGLYSPEIIHADGFDRYVSSTPFHEAGYDAYLAGYVFVRMAHLCAQKDVKASRQKVVTFLRYLKVMEPFVNSVNLIRANCQYLNLNASDPNSVRPNWLVIETTAGRFVDTSEIIDVCSQHGSVDVKLLDQHRALVAAINFMTYRGIIKAYRQDKDFRVTKYSYIKHSKLCRSSLWATAVLFSLGGFGILLAFGRNSM